MKDFRHSSGRRALAAAVVLLSFSTAHQAAADSQPYIGEISQMGVTQFCPQGMMSAEGQILSISENDALFSLIGTYYGGDGRTTFALPDLRGRLPIGTGSGPGLATVNISSKAGQENVTLTQANLAPHSHTVNATNSDGNFPGPGDKLLAAAPSGGAGAETIYSDQAANVQMSAEMIAPSGGGQPLNVQDPTQTIRYCIAITGVYPSRS